MNPPVGTKFRCPVCGHEVTLTAELAKARQGALRLFEATGGSFAGPYCIACKRAGRQDMALVPVGELDPNVGPCGTCGVRHLVGACP